MTTLMTEAAPNTEGSSSTTDVVPPVSTEGAAPVTQQDDAAKVAADKVAADAAEAAKGEKPVVPEAYADFTLPEGDALPEGMADDIKSLAKELSLTQEQAQKVADFNLKHSKAATEGLQTHLTNLRSEWVGAVQADKELGGDKLAVNLGIAHKGQAEFTTPELRKMLDETGFGDHPEVVRMFFKIGQKLGEDTFVPGANLTPIVDPAKRLFPNMN